MIWQCGGEQTKNPVNRHASVEQRGKCVFRYAKVKELRRQRILNHIVHVRSILAWREDQIGAQRHNRVADFANARIALLCHVTTPTTFSALPTACGKGASPPGVWDKGLAPCPPFPDAAARPDFRATLSQ